MRDWGIYHKGRFEAISNAHDRTRLNNNVQQRPIRMYIEHTGTHRNAQERPGTHRSARERTGKTYNRNNMTFEYRLVDLKINNSTLKWLFVDIANVQLRCIQGYIVKNARD